MVWIESAGLILAVLAALAVLVAAVAT